MVGVVHTLPFDCPTPVMEKRPVLLLRLFKMTATTIMIVVPMVVISTAPMTTPAITSLPIPRLI